MTDKQGTKEKEVWTPAQFAEEYQKLVERSGFMIAPAWTPTNHGSYELALSVVRSNQNG